MTGGTGPEPTLLDFVLAHATRGWHIFPCAGKTPVVKWTMASTVASKMLDTWWSQQDYNIGIDCGKSGLVVIDEDTPGAFEQFCRANNQPTPATYTVSTGRGRHYYFLAPEGAPIRNSASKIAEKIDIRGDGGYVIGVGSTHENGNRYTLVVGGELAPFPAWIAELVRNAPPPDPMAPPDQMANSAPGFVLPDVIRDGERDDTLFRYASQLRARNLADHEQEMLMRAAWERCEQPPVAGSPFTWDEARTKLGQASKFPAGKSPEYQARETARQVSGSPEREPLDVSNSAVMADWLRDNMGQGVLSEMYLRGVDEIVHVPHRGDEGYSALTNSDSDDDGPAQVRALRPDGIASKVSYLYEPYRSVKNQETKEWEQKKQLFPPAAALTAFASPELMRNLRPLRGVVHSPTIRRDGSLLDTAGYDPSTGLLYQPTPGLDIGPVPEVPTVEDVRRAREMLLYMIADFSFETEVDRANYLGMLLTPLMRAITPPPYKMALIEAHQPASGKTFLARALTLIHGGVIRSEMPHDETEVTKVITAILDTTTAPVVVFDNATGLIQSSVMSGMLTQSRWIERRLGTGGMVDAKNDRLWVLTGNNLAISGDLDRRTMRVKIDPGVPHPELRTGFAIRDFEGWVITQRGNLLWSLLVLIRSWFANGQPLGGERGADNYRRWAASVEGILGNGGFGSARFTDPAIVSTSGAGAEDEEWRIFLEAVYAVKGSGPWTAREILALVDDNSLIEGASPLRPIPYDALPGELLAKRRPHEPLSRVGRALGWWLSHREGRWAGQFCARRGSETAFGVQWSVARYESS